MKQNLLVIILILVNAVLGWGQTSDMVTDEEMEEMLRETKETTLQAHKLSQTPLNKLTNTKDVREEARKYLEAWIKKDAGTILAYMPPFKIKEEIESAQMLYPVLKKLGVNLESSKNLKPIDLINAKMKAMSKDTILYNSFKIGEITETGILTDEYYKQASVFAVINFQADIYMRGAKDILNGNIIGYTDGRRWFFQERQGLSENLLKWMKSEAPDSEVSETDKK